MQIRLVQAQSDSMHTQLAETTAQLRALKVQQKQLEARNLLLEHVARIHQGPMPSSQAADNTIQSDLGQVKRGIDSVQLQHSHA